MHDLNWLVGWLNYSNVATGPFWSQRPKDKFKLWVVISSIPGHGAFWDTKHSGGPAFWVTFFCKTLMLENVEKYLFSALSRSGLIMGRFLPTTTFSQRLSHTCMFTHWYGLGAVYYCDTNTWSFRECFSQYRNLEIQSLLSQLIQGAKEQLRTFVMFPNNTNKNNN